MGDPVINSSLCTPRSPVTPEGGAVSLHLQVPFWSNRRHLTALFFPFGFAFYEASSLCLTPSSLWLEGDFMSASLLSAWPLTPVPLFLPWDDLDLVCWAPSYRVHSSWLQESSRLYGERAVYTNPIGSTVSRKAHYCIG